MELWAIKNVCKDFLREMAEIDLVYSIWFYVHKRIVALDIDFLSKLMYYIFLLITHVSKKRKEKKEIIYILYIELNEILLMKCPRIFPFVNIESYVKLLHTWSASLLLSLVAFSNLWMVAYRPSVSA